MKSKTKKIIVILSTLLIVIGLMLGCDSSSEPTVTPEAPAKDGIQLGKPCGSPDCPDAAVCVEGGDCGCRKG